MRLFQRLRPWLILGIVLVNVTLAITGMFSVRTAALVTVAGELLMWLLLMVQTPVAIRRYRHSRADGADRWIAAEQALGALMPPSLARWTIAEPRLWAGLIATLLRRRHRDGFTYHAERRPLLIALICLVTLETVVAHLILTVIAGNRWWVWLITGLGVYGVVWLAGVYVGFVRLPHQLAPDGLTLRYGILDQLLVPAGAVVGVRRQIRDDTRTKHLRPDDAGTAMFSCGTANVVLDLDPDRPLIRRGTPMSEPVRTLHVTADDPDAFVAALRAHTP